LCEKHYSEYDARPAQYAPAEISVEELNSLLNRIQNYLECGGLFNPECMEHEKVRDLLIDCRAAIKKAGER
jgi:hypothetical protein